MRPALLNLAPALALLAGACATTPSDLPEVRYAQAFSQGSLSTFMAGRPQREQVELANDRWSRAVADAYACGLPKLQVLEGGFVAAMELAAMSSLSRGEDSEDARNRALKGYVSRLANLATSPGARPPGPRCEALRGWLTRTREDGREALGRAYASGLLFKL
jgi:hypothetical protein